MSDQSIVIQRLRRYQNFITGCHNKYISSNTSLTIELILVDPEYRKQGVGNLLMDDIIEFCKLNSIPTIYMFTTSTYFTKLNFKTLDSTDELLLLSNCSSWNKTQLQDYLGPYFISNSHYSQNNKVFVYWTVQSRKPMDCRTGRRHFPVSGFGSEQMLMQPSRWWMIQSIRRHRRCCQPILLVATLR